MGGDERSLGRKGTAGPGPAQDGDARPASATAARIDATSEQAHDWRPARFMVIAAHPDDAEFGPAGTAARWIDDGSEGWLVCCTSGDQGGEDPDADPLELAALRETEQRAAAAVIGYAGRVVPAPARRRPRQRPRPARAAGPRDPDVPPGRGPRHRPGGALLSRRRRQPHRPSRGRLRGGRRGLSGGPQPDGVPVAGPRRPRGARVRRLYLFWSNQPNAWIDITADDRPQDRGAAPRTPARSTTPRASRRGSGPGRPRRARRSGSPRPRRCG